MTPEIFPLFPVAVYKNIIRAPSENELKHINSIEMKTQTSGNLLSTDRYVLDHPELADLKKVILDNIKIYAEEIISTDQELYITNSWKNANDQHQRHMIHNHTNSIISGCYYINVESSLPSVSFNRMGPPFLLNLLPKKFNLFNSIDWSIPLENNCLLIFPSAAYHHVPPNPNPDTRISIAFNTFLRGTIGTNSGGADLILN